MINLLTTEGKAAVVQEYRKRRSRTGGIFSLIIWLAGIALVGTLIFQVKIKQDETRGALERLSLSPNKENDAKALIQKTNLEIATLKSNTGTRPIITDWWRVIINSKPDSIQITDWLWTASDGKDKMATLNLAGQADTRQSLLDFVERLKQDPAISAVESPVSNLIKNRDLDFTLKLNLADI